MKVHSPNETDEQSSPAKHMDYHTLDFISEAVSENWSSATVLIRFGETDSASL
jgi:hypothetical protein